MISDLREISSIKKENLISINYILLKDNFLALKMLDYSISLSSVNPVEYFEESGIYDILSGICNGIRDLNSFGKYYGNLKPSNIFLNESGKVLLSDYLLLKLYKGSEMKRNYNENDLCYVSYEELLNLEIDKSVDIWCFGCVFYYLLKNENIFKGKNICETIDNIRDCKYEKFEGESSNEFNNLFEKLISKDVNKRLNIDEIISELKGINIYSIKIIEINKPQLPVEAFIEEKKKKKNKTTSNVYLY